MQIIIHRLFLIVANNESMKFKFHFSKNWQRLNQISLKCITFRLTFLNLIVNWHSKQCRTKCFIFFSYQIIIFWHEWYQTLFHKNNDCTFCESYWKNWHALKISCKKFKYLTNYFYNKIYSRHSIWIDVDIFSSLYFIEFFQIKFHF